MPSYRRMFGRRVGCVPAARTLHTKQAGGLRGSMGYLKNENTGFQVAFAGYAGFVRYTWFGIANNKRVFRTRPTPATGKAT